MKKYRMRGPDGSWWVTMAVTIEKARANFAHRLRRAGMYVGRAYECAEADTEEVTS